MLFGISVGSELAFVVGEDGSCEFFLAVKVVVEVEQVVLALDYGVVDVGAVNGYPADEIFICLVVRRVFLVYRAFRQVFDLLLGGSLEVYDHLLLVLNHLLAVAVHN